MFHKTHTRELKTGTRWGPYRDSQGSQRPREAQRQQRNPLHLVYPALWTTAPFLSENTGVLICITKGVIFPYALSWGPGTNPFQFCRAWGEANPGSLGEFWEQRGEGRGRSGSAGYDSTWRNNNFPSRSPNSSWVRGEADDRKGIKIIGSIIHEVTLPARPFSHILSLTK